MSKDEKKQGRPQCPDGKCMYWSQARDSRTDTHNGCTYSGSRGHSDETGACGVGPVQ